MLSKNRTHAIRSFLHIFPATMTLSRPVGGTPRIQNIACNFNISPENLGHQKFEYDRIELFVS